MGNDTLASPLTILIPAYNPDEKLLALLPRLRERFRHIVLVNDGSTTGKDVFERAVPLVDAILVHEKNRGKGAALKTGFAYIGDAADVITTGSIHQRTSRSWRMASSPTATDWFSASGRFRARFP